LLLRAVESSTASRVRAASLTTIFGWTIDDLVHLDPERFVDLSSVIRRLGPLLADHGAMTIHQWLIEHTDIERRVHASADGERYLADFRHVAHLLNGPRPVFVSPLEWLSSRRLDGPMSDDTSRRSPTQADAVRILTIHQAKGLQFPIVYLPQLADHHQQVPPPRSPVVTSDLHGDRVVDLGLSDQSSPTRGPGPNRDDAETLRSAYVGLTRATTHITTWWLPTTANTETSALHRLLFRDGPAPASRISLEGADPRRLTIPGLTVETMPPDQPVGPAAATPVSPGAIDPSQASPPPAQTPPRLRRRLNRPIDQDWRRTSFSALTASAHHDVRADDHGVDADSVSRSLATTTTADDHDPQLDQLSPMAELPGGAAFGSLVHTVFEHADPAAGSLADTVAAAMTTSGFLELPPEELTKTLSAGLTTPLGSIADGLSLAEIPLSDRLAELSFELPLGRGQEAVSLPDIARSLRQHLSADDPLHEYPSHLESADLDQRALRGYLSGAIDVVLRVNGRYLIVDYKTNRLGAPGTPLTLRSYTMPGLTQAMIASHYPLQALLYAVALHRFLRWRLPGYDPGHHLGGIAYLFVRGMAGPATPTQDGAVCGVFPWRPPHRLITGLSDQLAGVQS
ncbi:MAG: PD-(D/E)XK nuclease family protein, partial [Propionibacteriaceae bacterium]|jgi:exodeoxyribonuclease V beta subunit|nr:PD-(D/E)XK nuclease family protein [Propionibacteriaceae bacterium]